MFQKRRRSKGNNAGDSLFLGYPLTNMPMAQACHPTPTIPLVTRGTHKPKAKYLSTNSTNTPKLGSWIRKIQSHHSKWMACSLANVKTCPKTVSFLWKRANGIHIPECKDEAPNLTCVTLWAWHSTHLYTSHSKHDILHISTPYTALHTSTHKSHMKSRGVTTLRLPELLARDGATSVGVKALENFQDFRRKARHFERKKRTKVKQGNKESNFQGKMLRSQGQGNIWHGKIKHTAL